MHDVACTFVTGYQIHIYLSVNLFVFFVVFLIISGEYNITFVHEIAYGGEGKQCVCTIVI